jgi:hypothetical protein
VRTEPARNPLRTKRKPGPSEKGLVRITVDVPRRQHRQLRIAALDRRVSVRQLVLDLLAREGINNEDH